MSKINNYEDGTGLGEELLGLSNPNQMGEKGYHCHFRSISEDFCSEQYSPEGNGDCELGSWGIPRILCRVSEGRVTKEPDREGNRDGLGEMVSRMDV